LNYGLVNHFNLSFRACRASLGHAKPLLSIPRLPIRSWTSPSGPLRAMPIEAVAQNTQYQIDTKVKQKTTIRLKNIAL